MAVQALAHLSVSGDLAALLCEFLRQRGDLNNPLYSRLLRFDANKRLTFTQWWQALDELQRIYPDLPVSVLVGESVKASHLGVIGYLTQACHNVLEAFQRFERYQRLLHDGDKARLVVDGDTVGLVWSRDYEASTQISDEVFIVGMMTFIRSMTGREDLNAVRADFFWQESSNTSALVAALGGDVCFEKEANALWLPLSALQLPVKQFDFALRGLLEQQAEGLLSGLNRDEDFIHAFHTELLRALQNSDPKVGRVAKALAMSERTLVRRLEEQGTNFREALLQLRLQLACQYLTEQRLTLTEIALLLGYSEQAAFARTFRKLTGQTPRTYQQDAIRRRRQ
ncbi:MAG: helix-turn-helix domain-containing protein [Thalassolituus oleivorans]|jgi:AraC-like DNA-binding protein|uniref:AraC family transcriptional regulator n=1 Tax=Thalassolituus oleivorans TaxID=187493 RepID=UPI001B536799|nr:AraC family transcriptional regulator [Thalassolituus oleivorans]MBQ0727513.1 helix-turn-helix domain-containing protein [Thalassolituus oleivorans]